MAAFCPTQMPYQIHNIRNSIDSLFIRTFVTMRTHMTANEHNRIRFILPVVRKMVASRCNFQETLLVEQQLDSWLCPSIAKRCGLLINVIKPQQYADWDLRILLLVANFLVLAYFLSQA